MSYNYNAEKPFIFTEEGNVMLLSIRDNVHRLIQSAGAVRMQEAIAGHSGDAWSMLACVDRLVELKEIYEVTPANVPGQYRIFTKYK